MPTLLRINGYRVVIYPADHEPMHVHVINSEGEVVIEIGPKARQIRSGAMNGKAIKEARQIVRDNADMLAQAWERIHGE